MDFQYDLARGLSIEDLRLVVTVVKQIRVQVERLDRTTDAAATWKEFHVLHGLFDPKAVATVQDVSVKYMLTDKVLLGVVRHLRRHPASKVGGCTYGLPPVWTAGGWSGA